jgi:hypothetical protein
MSTRCQIGFMKDNKNPNKPEILIYRHSDGYPEGVKEAMETFFPKFLKERGATDLEYMGAQFLASMIHDMQDWSKTLDESSTRTWEFLGYGICGDKEFHGDIEFYYAIRPADDEKAKKDVFHRVNKVIVDVYEPIKDKNFEVEDFKLLETWEFEAEKGEKE